jgi:hypothetical protein
LEGFGSEAKPDCNGASGLGRRRAIVAVPKRQVVICSRLLYEGQMTTCPFIFRYSKTQKNNDALIRPHASLSSSVKE